jgi:hypothetical protein
VVVKWVKGRKVVSSSEIPGISATAKCASFCCDSQCKLFIEVAISSWSCERRGRLMSVDGVDVCFALMCDQDVPDMTAYTHTLHPSTLYKYAHCRCTRIENAMCTEIQRYLMITIPPHSPYSSSAHRNSLLDHHYT